MSDKNGFPHFMLKEIFEQPKALAETIAPRVSLEPAGVRIAEEVRIPQGELRELQRINIVASGTSRHAGIVGQHIFQELVRLPVEVDYASEFENRNPLIGRAELTIVITQSGETADTTGAQREAKKKGSRTIAISNVLNSTIAREADGVLYTNAGPGISIASTKAFTAQMAVLFLLAAYIGSVREDLSEEQLRGWIEELLDLPRKADEVLKQAPLCQRLAERFRKMEDFLFLGRAIHYPIAMDGALKLKEVSYVHAEGYPTGETKHGPNALIDENLPDVILATRDESDHEAMTRYEKSVSNIKEVKARDGIVISVVTANDHLAREASDHIIELPPAPELLVPLLEIIPLQLLAYHIAVRRGCDVDQPRNLAKSVTVE